MKEANVKSTISTCIAMLQYVFQCKGGGFYLFLKLTSALFSIVVPLIIFRLNGDFLDTLASSDNISRLISLAIAIIMISLLSYVITKIIEWYIIKKQKSLEIMFQTDFYLQSMKIDYALLEQPEILVKKIRAGTALLSGINIIDKIIGLFSSILTVILVIVLLDSKSLPLIFVAICFEVIGFFIKNNSLNKSVTLDKERSKRSLVLGVYQNTIESINAAKEIRVFQLAHFLTNFYKNKRFEVADIEEKQWRVSEKPNIVIKIFEIIRTCIVYGTAIYRFAVAGLAVGSFTVLIAYINQVASAFSGFVNGWLSIKKSNIQFQEYFSFLKLVSDNNTWGDKHPEITESSNIEFVNVSFRYPGSDKYVLKNCNIKINCFEKLCIVGENGAGKSTFIKLLCGLYTPSQGYITLNGIDLKEYNIDEYRRLISTVFQDYVLYPFSIKDNIILSHGFNEELFYDAVKKCNLSHFINALPLKEETSIGKEIYSNGVNPSGGEGQRIAIARAIYHGGEMFILDEPTAALDPNAEYEIYTQFHDMIKGKTAILVTHRLSAVQLADKVAVFDNGQIVEYGTHSELYARGGQYKEMFDRQSEFYVKAANETEQQNNS